MIESIQTVEKVYILGRLNEVLIVSLSTWATLEGEHRRLKKASTKCGMCLAIVLAKA
jgi:hypothetical protein